MHSAAGFNYGTTVAMEGRVISTVKSLRDISEHLDEKLGELVRKSLFKGTVVVLP